MDDRVDYSRRQNGAERPFAESRVGATSASARRQSHSSVAVGQSNLKQWSVLSSHLPSCSTEFFYSTCKDSRVDVLALFLFLISV